MEQIKPGIEIDIRGLTNKYAISDRYSKLNSTLAKDSSCYEFVDVETVLDIFKCDESDHIEILGKYSQQYIKISKLDVKKGNVKVLTPNL